MMYQATPTLYKKLFIGSIPTKTKPTDLLAQLKRVASDIELASTHRGETINAGFTIISCDNEGTYKKLLEEDIFYFDRLLDMKPFREGKDLEKHKKCVYAKRLVIDPLPEGVSKEDLATHFRQIGPLEKTFVLRIKHIKQQDKITGHVLFRNLKCAKKAIQKREFMLKGSKVGIETYDEYTERTNNEREQKHLQEQQEKRSKHVTRGSWLDPVYIRRERTNETSIFNRFGRKKDAYSPETGTSTNHASGLYELRNKNAAEREDIKRTRYQFDPKFERKNAFSFETDSARQTIGEKLGGTLQDVSANHPDSNIRHTTRILQSDDHTALFAAMEGHINIGNAFHLVDYHQGLDTVLSFFKGAN